MRYILPILLIAILTGQIGRAQYLLKDFAWADSNYFEGMTNLKVEDDAHVLLQERSYEYYYEPSGELFQLFLFHQVAYINSEKGVEDNNKVYVNLSSTMELTDYNARVLYKDKESQVLGREALKEGTTEEGSTYKYFAMEGVEVGSIVEYFYIKKSYPNVKGSYLFLQSDYPVVRSQFRMASPSNLVFTAEAKNGLPEVQFDSTYTFGRLLKLDVDNVAKLPDEEYSNTARERYQIVYKLSANKAKNTRNLFDYGEVSQNVFENMVPKDPKKEQKAMQKFLKPAGLEFAADERDKIFRIENYIKKSIGVAQNSDARLSDVAFIMENKVANEYGFSKLLFQAFYLMDINFEVVLTCSRFETEFDEKIQNYSFLSEYVFYFPGIKDYLAPNATLYRLGILPYGYIGNNGLYVRKVSVGDMVTGAGSIKPIPVYGKDHTTSNMEIKVNFDEAFEKITVDLKQTFTGYDASNVQPVYDYIQADKMTEFKEGIVKGLGENITVEKVEIESAGTDNFMKVPFVVKSTFNSEEFIELAGNKVLFKVGELIGPQAELYENKKRLTDVENRYNHGYTRVITFKIPEGYKCANLSDLKMDVDPFKDQGSHTAFKSVFSESNGEVTVNITEYYDQIFIDKSRFEDFRAVINAAADFNKITLVFEEI